MTQQTDTSALITKCQAIAAAVADYDCRFSELLNEVVGRLEEQEATIRHLRVEICNASAVAMEHLGAIRTFREELDLLNKRPKR
jgi:hypothetical protein